MYSTKYFTKVYDAWMLGGRACPSFLPQRHSHYDVHDQEDPLSSPRRYGPMSERAKIELMSKRFAIRNGTDKVIRTIQFSDVNASSMDIIGISDLVPPSSTKRAYPGSLA